MTARKHKALGKGLGALFGNSKTIVGGEAPLQDVDTNLVNPDNVDSPATMETSEVEISEAAKEQPDTKKTRKGRTSLTEAAVKERGNEQAAGSDSTAGKEMEESAGEKKKAAETSVSEIRDTILQSIAVVQIRANRYQPRHEFDESALEELKESILQHGVLQPILVRQLPADQGYELIAGERRLRAAKMAGLTEIPALVRPLSDAATSEISLIENLQREDLNAIEEAAAYQNLMQTFGITQEVLAERVGRSRSHIANMVRLLKLESHVREYLANGSLTMGQARPLLGLEDPTLQREAADIIMTREYSARQAEELVKRMQKETKEPKDMETPVESQTIFLQEAEDKLKMFFGTQVRIRTQGKKRRIEIDFSSEDDLNRILASLLEQKSKMLEDRKAALRQFSSGSNFIV